MSLYYICNILKGSSDLAASIVPVGGIGGIISSVLVIVLFMIVAVILSQFACYGEIGTYVCNWPGSGLYDSACFNCVCILVIDHCYVNHMYNRYVLLTCTCTAGAMSLWVVHLRCFLFCDYTVGTA